ncbi:uncharacterized protein LOC142529043 [Primulina tabacum]|uniref:uncharacterized protein LOC142529043 n=1 Tax=Primulina tabacum TaxID=48773 RepID=UPI003F59426D
MADDILDEKLLMEKLSKLNSSQQSIETLSRWCVFHRKKAQQVVEIWDRLFKSAQQEQLVSFLYLANDVLQNSRRKGSEFVSEYLKVLPSALKFVHETGNENCRKAASRLVDIWEERKVFGSRVQNLKNEMLGNNLSAVHSGNLSPDISTGTNSNPIKVAKRDKSAVGGLPRKLLTTFQLVQEEEVHEETTLNICGNVVSSIQEILDFVGASSQGNLQGSDIVDYIQKQENILQQCISQLEGSAAIRVTLISQLKKALQDQEFKLDLLRNELHVAQSQIEKAENISLKLTSSPTVRTANQPIVETGFSTVKNWVGPSFSNKEESKKATAAALAAQLTSISSSAQMLTSILSSLVAEEAASKSSGLKWPKLESPSPPFSSLNNAEVVSSTYFPQLIPSQAPFCPPLGSSYNHGLSNQLPPPTMVYSGPGSSPQQTSQQPQFQQHQQPGSGGHFGSYEHQSSIHPVQKQ